MDDIGASWDEDYNRKRDWYRRLIDGGATDIMLEESDWQGYFHWIGTDLEVHEQQMKEWWEAEQQRRAPEVNCPVFDVDERELKLTLWQKFKDAFSPIPGSGPGSP